MNRNTYLFEYDHDGKKWSLEILANSEQEAKDRVDKLRNAEFVGVLQMRIPVELGIFGRLICWWQNRQPLKIS